MSFDPVDFIRTQTEIAPAGIVPEIKLHLATEVTPLWQLTEERLREGDLPPPFWAFAWPGGQGMARYILDNPDLVRGKRIVDFGAGSGIAAIAAMQAGAKSALAVDIDTLALTSITLNAELNNVKVDIAEGLDLEKPYTKADIIFAGDICYQQSMSTKLTRWLYLCIAKGVVAYIADPGRAYVPHDGLTKLTSYDVPTSRDLEDQDMRVVSVWRMDKVPEA